MKKSVLLLLLCSIVVGLVTAAPTTYAQQASSTTTGTNTTTNATTATAANTTTTANFTMPSDQEVETEIALASPNPDYDRLWNEELNLCMELHRLGGNLLEQDCDAESLTQERDSDCQFYERELLICNQNNSLGRKFQSYLNNITSLS